jgi:DNA-binding beta-propeller fold protein YncE
VRGPAGYYEVAVSPDGRNVYAVTEEFDFHAFGRDPATGALTRIKGKRGCAGFARSCTLLKGISSPEDVRVSDDGRFVYLAAAEGVTVYGGRHLYALESAYSNSYGTGVVQLMKRH